MNNLEYQKRSSFVSLKFTVPGCPLLRNLIKNVKYVRRVSSLLLKLYSVKAEKAAVARSGETELQVPFV